MNEETFWSLVEASKKAGGGDPEAQAKALTKALAELPPVDILEFYRLWKVEIYRAYTWDLWAAAYIIKGGCSDDSFEYFRGWLIGQGRQVFEAALKDPEMLVDVADSQSDNENEDLLYAASEAYEKVTGAEFSYDHLPPRPKEPAGEEWDEDAVGKKFPKLAAKFDYKE